MKDLFRLLLGFFGVFQKVVKAYDAYQVAAKVKLGQKLEQAKEKSKQSGIVVEAAEFKSRAELSGLKDRMKKREMRLEQWKEKHLTGWK